MNTTEILRLQALKLKQLTQRGSSDDRMIDHLIEQNPEETKQGMRNICAFISPELFADVNGLCEMLDLSKRRVVEMALMDFIEKASNIITEVNPLGEVA
jgi:hypothetical protein